MARPSPERADAASTDNRRIRASDRIADTLRREIVAGHYPAGVLESTPRLMDRFRVSRPTLREAFRVLESERLVEVRQGSRSGVRVMPPTGAGAARMIGQALQAERTTIEQLYEARLAFEPFAARLVAQRCDRRDISALRDALAAMREMVDRQNWRRLAGALARFHHLLVQCTGNRMLMLTAETIATLLERHQYGEEAPFEADDDRLTLEFRSRGVRSSARLLALIEAGDADGAEAHWREHTSKANDYWLARQDRHGVIDVVGAVLPIR